jgi:hypothetical protein
MSAGRRARVRSRLREVDSVIAALSESGVEFDSLVRLRFGLFLPRRFPAQTKAQQLPKEKDMPARDKYTTFSRYGFKHRKSVHKVSSSVRVPVLADARRCRTSRRSPIGRTRLAFEGFAHLQTHRCRLWSNARLSVSDVHFMPNAHMLRSTAND